jgi:hypothetical protein
MWDAMAFFVYFLQIFFRKFPKPKTYAVKYSQNARRQILRLVLNPYYFGSRADGADTIIVAIA